MKHGIRNWKFAVLAAGTCAMALVGSANLAKAESFTPEQKQELQEIFKEFLYENPEIILEAVDRFRANQEKKSRQSAQENLEQYKEYFAQSDLPMAGNPDGDVTIVEFFDYNCGYCRKAFADLVKLIEEDSNVRVVFQEMPILSPASRKMAMISLAAHQQGKYFEMHKALMDYKGNQGDEAFYKVAEGLGLDVEKLKADVESPAMAANIKKFLERGQSLGIRGTPGFVVGDKVFPGYIGLKGLRDAVATARKAAEKAE
ncbi:MAG: DsbA family protein [Alphaproteobacteria bacterium]